MKSSLTIAGSDPTGGAGAQSDIATFRALGVGALSAITAVTAQNGEKVFAVEPVSPRLLTRQVTALLDAFDIRSVKIGMLGSVANATAVERLIKRAALENVVLDTVLRSSGGHPLIGKDGVEAIKRLIPLCRIVTPNLAEASLLTGVKVYDEPSMERAALLIHSMGAPFVLITGGHLKGAPTDLLYDGRGFSYFAGKRVAGGAKKTHGTGCMLSAAIAASLAKGRGVKRAVKDAKAFVEESLRKRR